VQDKQLVGEFFIMLVTPTHTSTVNNETGFAEKPGPKMPGSNEKKLIPILDVKLLESLDNLTFSIVLHDECQLNSYDVAEAGGQGANKRSSSLISAFGNMLTNANN